MKTIINKDNSLIQETNLSNHGKSIFFNWLISLLTIVVSLVIFICLFFFSTWQNKKLLAKQNEFIATKNTTIFLSSFSAWPKNTLQHNSELPDLFFWNNLFSAKNKLFLPVFLEENPIFLNYPFEYTVKGNGDHTFQLLSLLFFLHPDGAMDIYLENKNSLPAKDFDIDSDLPVGSKISIPKPSIYPYIKQYKNIEDIPHLDSKKDEIVTKDGKILATAEEIEFYVHVVVAEASQQWDYEGTRMIAESITNRVRKNKESLYETLTKDKQYDVVSNKLYLSVKISENQRKAAMDALNEKNNKYLTNDILFFATLEAVEKTPWFKNLKKAKIYKGVAFFSDQPNPEKDSSTIEKNPETPLGGNKTDKEKIEGESKSENKTDNNQTIPPSDQESEQN